MAEIPGWLVALAVGVRGWEKKKNGAGRGSWRNFGRVGEGVLRCGWGGSGLDVCMVCRVID